MTSITPETALERAFGDGSLPGAGPVLAAVSGGPDSMALVGALAAVAPRWRVPFAVGHVDHGWRGDRSAADARFVEAFCQKRGIAFRLARVDAPARGRSREDAAREARYRALSLMRDELGASAIVTAHTRDDAAETILLAVLRGRPLSGLSGIRRKREDGVHRPFLDVSRPAILAYLRAGRIPYRRDSTNDDPSFDRNWVRRRVVPLLRRRFGDSVTANLAASAEALSRDREWIETFMARDIFPSLVVEGRSTSGEAALLAAMPPAALRRALLAMAERAGGRPISRRELLAVEALVRKGDPFSFQAGRRVDFQSRRGRISARPAAGTP
jgi:tRNA(Ile)-lysidine synthase